MITCRYPAVRMMPNWTSASGGDPTGGDQTDRSFGSLDFHTRNSRWLYNRENMFEHRISLHTASVEDALLGKCMEKGLCSPLALHLNHIFVPLTAGTLSLLIPSAWIIPCEWARRRQLTCNDLLISLPGALPPTCITEHPGYSADADVCTLKEYGGRHLSAQSSSSCYHKALAGRGCAPRGHEGRGGRYPQASPGCFWPAVTLTRWREWGVESVLH